MAPRKKIFVAITDHGFGHLAQLSDWLNTPETNQQFDVTLQTSLAPQTVQQLIPGPIKHICHPTDPGMVMKDALQVNPQATFARYHTHLQTQASWQKKTQQLMIEAEAEIVLSNVGWTALLAAQTLKLPNFGISSFNWSDLFTHYCGHYPQGLTLGRQILKAYSEATGFITLTPSMTMHHLPGPRLGFTARLGQHTRLTNFAHLHNLTQHKSTAQSPAIPPPEMQHQQGLEHKAQDHRAQAQEGLIKRLPKDIKWVLISPGGLPLDLAPLRWPHCDNIQWIFTGQNIPKDRRDMHTPETLGLRFIDLIASVDAIITKPGYGTFTEAALHCCPVLYIQRPDWPEQAALTSWLATKVPCHAISWQAFQSGGWLDALQKLLAKPRQLGEQPKRIAESKATVTQLNQILIQAIADASPQKRSINPAAY